MDIFVEKKGEIPTITFDKLVFERHPVAIEAIELKKRVSDFGKTLTEMTKATQAKVDLLGGYCISVVCGSCFYSNGKDTYECAVAKDGKMVGDVLPHQSWLDVEELLAEYQGYDIEFEYSNGASVVITYTKKNKEKRVFLNKDGSINFDGDGELFCTIRDKGE